MRSHPTASVISSVPSAWKMSQHSTVQNQVTCPELTLTLYKDKVLGILNCIALHYISVCRTGAGAAQDRGCMKTPTRVLAESTDTPFKVLSRKWFSLVADNSFLFWFLFRFQFSYYFSWIFSNCSPHRNLIGDHKKVVTVLSLNVVYELQKYIVFQERKGIQIESPHSSINVVRYFW